MELVDVHCHLNMEQFDLDRAQVIEDAKKAGVIAILDSGKTLEENKKILELAEQYQIIRPALGFNPKNLGRGDANAVIEHNKENSEKITAIGEVGLDYWHVKEHPDREKQKEIFRLFIQLAKELDKPLVVHSRSAGKYCIEILKAEGAERVCMHAFDGSVVNAQKGLELGYCFSIPPSIVRSVQKQKLVEALPLENMLLETDSPVLGPCKEERNVPANVVISAEKIAELKQLSVEEIARATTENARSLFRL